MEFNWSCACNSCSLNTQRMSFRFDIRLPNEITYLIASYQRNIASTQNWYYCTILQNDLLFFGWIFMLKTKTNKSCPNKAWSATQCSDGWTVKFTCSRPQCSKLKLKLYKDLCQPVNKRRVTGFLSTPIRSTLLKFGPSFAVRFSFMCLRYTVK